MPVFLFLHRLDAHKHVGTRDFAHRGKEQPLPQPTTHFFVDYLYFSLHHPIRSTPNIRRHQCPFPAHGNDVPLFAY